MLKKLLLLGLVLPSLAFSQSSLKISFQHAYEKYPNIPAGTLEGMAFSASRMQNIIPDADMDHHHAPNRYGLFGLIEDGEGYWDNNLSEVLAFSPYNGNFTQDLELQILSVAGRVSQLCNKHHVHSLENISPVLREFSEIPDNSEVNRYAQDLYCYEIFQNLTTGFGAQDIEMKPMALAYDKWFDVNTYEILRAPQVSISEQGISNGKSMYTGGGTNPNPLSADYPPALWVASPNYSSRAGTAITDVTIHTTQGSYAGSISWFQNTTSNVSAHYVLRSSDGQITQMVLESDKAWHVGNSNPYTIGLEHEGYVAQTGWYTTAMYTASANLVKDICVGNNIAPTTCYNGPSSTGTNVLATSIRIKGHQHFPSQTHTDPGINWDWAGYYNLINNVTSCGAPATLAAANITPNSVRLSWGAVAGASSYSLRYKTTAASTWTTVSASSTSQLVTGLVSSTAYQWAVAAVCGGVTSTYTNGTNFTTNPSSSSACTGNITDSGGTGNYGNSENWTFTIAPTGATGVSLTFNSFGLENNYDYVYIYNGNSTAAPLLGTYTGTTSPGTINSTGGALTLKFTSDGATVSWGFTATWTCSTCPAPSGLSASAITFNSAQLNWTAVTGATGYTVQYRPVGATTWTSVTTTTNTAAISGLNFASAYEWKVSTNCGTSASSSVSGTNFTTANPPCATPTSLASASITSTSAQLNWGAVTYGNTYKVEIKTAAATTWTVYTASSNTYAATSLLPSTTYNWRVTTNCTGGSSAATATQSFTTLAVPCNTPTGLAVSYINTTWANTGWTAVSGATGYVIEWKLGTATTWTTATVTTTSYTITGLAAASAYNCRIKTQCTGGVTSAYSTTVNFTTAASCYDAWEANNSSGTASALTSGTSKYGKICTSSTDVDWFKVTTTAASSSIVVNVSQLPKNYNLELYVGGAFVAGSYAAGTTSETITRTNQPAGTYYYRVYAATTTDYSSTGDYRILATVTPEAESHPTTNIADKEEILISFVTYPNPASDVLFIKPTEDIFMTGGRLKIVNVSGSVVYEKNMIDVSHDKPIEISLESFANGIYQFLLEDESNKLVATQRFIIQK